jgi:hypothetical protein
MSMDETLSDGANNTKQLLKTQVKGGMSSSSTEETGKRLDSRKQKRQPLVITKKIEKRCDGESINVRSRTCCSSGRR